MCSHNTLVVRTEADGCYWLQCAHCRARGPKRHSIPLAYKSANGNIKRRKARR